MKKMTLISLIALTAFASAAAWWAFHSAPKKPKYEIVKLEDTPTVQPFQEQGSSDQAAFEDALIKAFEAEAKNRQGARP
jgi:ABC-type glycerol-3-phosphate transport system substrate-binding protein